MKTPIYKKIVPWLLALLVALFLMACSKRDLTSNLITLYNSNLEKTMQFSPLDTMFVQLEGLGPDKYYTVEVLDPNNQRITKMVAKTDGEGKIGVTPLWYDVGLKKAGVGHPQPYVDTSAGLEVRAFNIHVVSDDGETDFKQPFYIFYNTSDVGNQPQPIVSSCDASGNIVNAFEETGSKEADGVTVSALTKVYVKAERIPLAIDGTPVNFVDVYVLPFNGDILADGTSLTSDAITQIMHQSVSADPGNSSNTKKLDPVLLWDMNATPQLINPTDRNSTYRIVLDVNRNGKYDKGYDVNSDGLTDKYIDGVDGNGVVGFIVQNTPANDVFVQIKDGTGPTANQVNVLLENVANDTRTLYFNMDNIMTGNATVRLYVVDSAALADGAAIPADVRAGGFSTATVSPQSGIRLLPYIANAALITTQAGQAISYTAALTGDEEFDIVVDANSNGLYDEGADYFLADAITIKDATVTLNTYSDSGAAQETRFFNETGSSAKTTVYIKFAVTGSYHDIYVLKARDWSTGDPLSRFVLKKNLDVTAGSIYALWNLNTEYQVKNPKANNNTYDIIVDMNDNGTYQPGTDLITSVVINNTTVSDPPNCYYANIASGGIFTYNYSTWQMDYDYRDTFIANGLDTKYAPYYGVNYGIKAIWNPYIKYSQGTTTPDSTSVYYGTSVDVYIVNADTFVLGAGAALDDTRDVTGRHKTLPIQYGCQNGLGQQNIWDAPMTPGAYHVIVDVDRDGAITEGVDIIDGVNRAGTTIVDDANVVGFTVQ
ncbi:MAG: hypothetical protein PHY31_05835 [Smithellaceae bacterium]|nr:hypothetical protein [Smithellaceae bacterium]